MKLLVNFHGVTDAILLSLAFCLTVGYAHAIFPYIEALKWAARKHVTDSYRQ